MPNSFKKVFLCVSRPIILCLLLFLWSNSLNGQNCLYEAKAPELKDSLRTSFGQSLFQSYNGGLTTINEQPYFYWIDTINLAMTLRLQNLESSEEFFYSLKPLIKSVETLPSITFVNERQFYIIGADNRSLVLYNYQKGEVEAKYSLKAALEKNEILYTRPDAKVSIVGT